MSISPDFDHVFAVTPGGTIIDGPEGMSGPERVTHDEEHDILIDGRRWQDAEWMPLTGYTSQYGYAGAVLASNEQFAGGLKDDVLADPGIYVMVAVEVDDEEQEDPEPAGWALLLLKD